MKLIDKKLFKNMDWFLLSLILILALSSLLFIANARATDISGDEANFGEILAKLDLRYVWLQLIWLLLGLAVMFVVLLVDYHAFTEFSKLLYLITLAMLLFLIVEGKLSRGVAGWISLGENRKFQPSELCKIALIISLSKLAANACERSGHIKRFSDIVKMVAIVGVPLVLVCLQPDYGTAFVFVIILLCIFFMGRISYKIFLAGLLAMAIILPLVYFFVLDDDLKNRILVFLNPGLEENARSAEYQINQARIAIGSGGLLGKGFFKVGTQTQLKFLPDAYTDFIFAVVVESTGFIGGTGIIFVYLLIILRSLYIASKARDRLGMFLVAGVLGMFAFHIFENIGMQVGLMPVTGIPLPFLSYGGSSMLMNMIAFSIVLNVSMRRPAKR